MCICVRKMLQFGNRVVFHDKIDGRDRDGDSGAGVLLDNPVNGFP